MASKPLCRMDPPPGASPPMRMTASWCDPCGSTEYKVVARSPRPDGELPSELWSFTRTAGEVARLTEPAAVLVTVKGESLRDGLRPPLDRHCARRTRKAGRDEEMVGHRSNKEMGNRPKVTLTIKHLTIMAPYKVFGRRR
jgi:hypothetical protein